MPNTAFSAFYTPLRTVLGDRDPFGQFAYSNTDLDSALNVLFLTGSGPEGYTAAAGEIAPALATTDAFALILFKCALMLLAGEDGAGSWKTKALSVTDMGQRKRDLLTELRLKLSGIENGGGIVFETQQNFYVWLSGITGATPAEMYQRGDLPLQTLNVPSPPAF